MLSSEAFLKCETAAQKIIADFSITEVPVPVFDIVPQLDIKLMEYNLGADTSGVLVVDNGSGFIGYNPHDPMTRKRFSVCHELGHYLLHKEKNELFVDNFFLIKFRKTSGYNPEDYEQELEANAFAAALLMPRKFLEDQIQAEENMYLNEQDLIMKLASIFQVSVPAMSYRLTNLNIF